MLCSEDRGTPVNLALRDGSVELMEQVLHIEGREFRLLVPKDVEAIMEMYIEAGASGFSFLCLQTLGSCPSLLVPNLSSHPWSPICRLC